MIFSNGLSYFERRIWGKQFKVGIQDGCQIQYGRQNGWQYLPLDSWAEPPKNPCRPVTEIQSKKSPFWRRKLCSGRVCFFIQCLLSNSWPKGQCISDSVFLEFLPFLKSWSFKTLATQKPVNEPYCGRFTADYNI